MPTFAFAEIDWEKAVSDLSKPAYTWILMEESSIGHSPSRVVEIAHFYNSGHSNEIFCKQAADRLKTALETLDEVLETKRKNDNKLSFRRYCVQGELEHKVSED